MMKKFWLIVNKETFIWTKGKNGLIYNTITKVGRRFHNTNKLDKIVKKLLVMDHLYRILLDEEQLSDEHIGIFIKELVVTQSAILTEDRKDIEIPVSLAPILKIQNNVHLYRHAEKKYKDESVISNCIRLVIHLNGSQYGDNDYAQQTIYPFKNTSNTIISLEEIKKFVCSAGTPYNLSEVILVGNVWEYDAYQEILEFFTGFSLPAFVYCTEKDYMENLSCISNDIKVHYYVIKDEYESFQPVADTNYQLIVTSEEEYEKAMDIIDNHPDIPCRIIPIYNGKNNQFFEENIFLTEEDVLDTHLTKREIFAHQCINTNHFGTLTITTDGNVYANLNEKPLGTIKDSLYSVTFRELTEGNSWLRIRDQKPCCDCIYQWLCPSPSHYEDVIGRPNLCHIKP